METIYFIMSLNGLLIIIKIIRWIYHIGKIKMVHLVVYEQTHCENMATCGIETIASHEIADTWVIPGSKEEAEFRIRYPEFSEGSTRLWTEQSIKTLEYEWIRPKRMSEKSLSDKRRTY